MGLIIVVHVIGAGVLLWAMLGEDDPGWREWWGEDDDGGGHTPAPARPGPGPDGLPLPDAVPSPVRLRGPERAGDWRPHRRTVPSHSPAPTPRAPVVK